MNMHRILYAAVVFAVLGSGVAQAQQVRGRVVDDRARRAVQNATVLLVDSAGVQHAGGTTGADGFFTLRAPGAGRYTILIQQPGYAENRRDVQVASSDLLVPAFVLETEAVQLDSIGVEARARPQELAPTGFQRSSHVISGAQLATLERQGGRFLTAVREMSSIRFREWSEEGRQFFCVQSVRAASSGLQIDTRARERRSDGGAIGIEGRGATDCQWVALVVDGILIGGDPMTNYRQLHLSDFESVEYLPPAEAGRLYGMAAASSGAIVAWSRGRGPHVSEQRNR
jgi:hypothetical protein